MNLIATFSGSLANTFLSAKSEQPEPNVDSDVHAALRDVERLLGEQQRATDTLPARLAELEAVRPSA
ncbi:MAG TPA: hypothetical protein VFR32_03965 [Gaiellaceae bacterium]|nr:hypothetical protein [Gaiellaceae bacterium]